ncbi:MAG: hypothetical protein HRU20_17375 [Pseudomonadales bacterium]|nr:hypothetical protein [Pseudomonadales bacterium]
MFDQRPDFVSLCIPWQSRYEPCFVSGEQLHAIAEFKQEYVPARFRGFEPYEYTGIVWVDKYSEKKLPAKVSGIRVQGPISISSIPEDQRLQFHISSTEDGRVDIEITSLDEALIPIISIVIHRI